MGNVTIKLVAGLGLAGILAAGAAIGASTPHHKVAARVADTALVIEVDRDQTIYGE